MSNITSKDLMNKRVLGQPAGLLVLFFTEFWERFSYYGMRAILVLYLIEKTKGDNPGWGWSEASAYELYGWYTMFVYVMSIPGGLIADKLLGQKRTVILGGWLLCAGHLTLAITAPWAFYTGIVFIILGVGCLKPNISTMVGGLYKGEQDKKDMGFYIFYMGINLGALLAPLLVGYIGQKISWHYGFGLAGIGMILGQLTFLWGLKYLKGIGDLTERKPIEINSQTPKINLLTDIFKHTNSLIAFSLTFLSGLIWWLYFGDLAHGALVMALSVGVGISFVVYNDGNKVEKDRIKVIFLALIMVIVFFGAFEQAGSLLNVYAEKKTNLHLFSYEIPASWFQSVNSLFILLFATLVGNFWIWWKNRKKINSGIFKIAVGIIIMGIGFLFMSAATRQYDAEGSSSMIFLVMVYLFSTLGELCASPVSLSLITKLAPLRWGSFFMGIYFASTGLGNKVAGSIAESSVEYGDFAIFTGIAIFCVIFGLLVIAIVKPLKRLTHGAEEDEHKFSSEAEIAEGFELGKEER